MNLIVGNRKLGHCIAGLFLIFGGVKSYELLISFEMFAGIFQAKAIRLAAVLDASVGELTCRCEMLCCPGIFWKVFF